MDNSIAITVKLPVSIESAWDSIQDWESQSDWMLQTRVWVTSEIREGIGTKIVIAPRALFLLTLPGLYIGLRISLNRLARALARTGGSGE